MKEDPGLKLVTNLLATADTFLREGQRLFRPLGLTAAQFNVLNILALHPDGVSQRELSDRLVVDRSNVTGLLDRLEKAGWVERRDDPEDRRIYLVTLTAAGRKLQARAYPLYVAVVSQVTRGLPASRVRDCLETLRHLEAGAKKWDVPGAGGRNEFESDRRSSA